MRELDDAELSCVSGGAPMWASYGSMDNFNLYSGDSGASISDGGGDRATNDPGGYTGGYFGCVGTTSLGVALGLGAIGAFSGPQTAAGGFAIGAALGFAVGAVSCGVAQDGNNSG